MNVEPTVTPEIDFPALDSMFDVSGYKIFIPGGYSAIGEAVAWGFARRGAHVAIAGRTGTRLSGLQRRSGPMAVWLTGLR